MVKECDSFLLGPTSSFSIIAGKCFLRLINSSIRLYINECDCILVMISGLNKDLKVKI